MENQSEKIVGQKCIGYQKDGKGSTNTVIQNAVRLENGEVKIDWQINYSNGCISLPLDRQPPIGIPVDQIAR